MRRTLHDLHSHVVVVLEVAGKPDCGEMAPAQFLDQDVPVHEHFSDMAGVVTKLNSLYPPIL